MLALAVVSTKQEGISEADPVDVLRAWSEKPKRANCISNAPSGRSARPKGESLTTRRPH